MRLFRILVRLLFNTGAAVVQKQWSALRFETARTECGSRSSSSASPGGCCAARLVLGGRRGTIVIDSVRIRLAGIDAPELDHPWGQRSKWALVQLCKGQMVTARITPELSYDRVVAACFLPDGRDLAAELVRRGLALDWPKFSGGKYRHLEPADARRKLWRADARQRGALRLQDDS